MTKKLRDSLFLPISDADYALHPIAVAMLKSGMNKKQALPALRHAATRMLSIAAMDRDVKVSRKALSVKARRIAAKLLA